VLVCSRTIIDYVNHAQEFLSKRLLFVIRLAGAVARSWEEVTTFSLAEQAPRFTRALRNHTAALSPAVRSVAHIKIHRRLRSPASFSESAGFSQSMSPDGCILPSACSEICTRCKAPLCDKMILVSRCPSGIASSSRIACYSKMVHFRELCALKSLSPSS